MPTSRQSPDDDRPETIKRLSLKLPESLHKRFKTACVATNRKMLEEVQHLVEHRTRELEDEAGLSMTTWGRQAGQPGARSAAAERKLRAIDRALGCNHPTADIEEMLADIERGRDLR